ncbi:MAG: AAA family ATPase [Thermodesulfobacteriota bacterium]
MFTRLIIRNFKKFKDADIELGNPVVFIGPNNSGKSSALQALALWDMGLRRWLEKRKGKTTPQQRSGVTINRKDLLAIPVASAIDLWKSLHVRDSDKNEENRKVTSNVRMDVVVEGVAGGNYWKCGLEFDYANDESFYCRPLRLSEEKNSERMEIPEFLQNTRVAFLPPMSGLVANETKLPEGAITRLIGEGRTAEVLRNLCYILSEEKQDKWEKVVQYIRTLFGSTLIQPNYVAERGEITMRYQEDNISFDISSSGRGLQQTLLLLAYMYVNPGAVILLDEPDAHLEILRQRQIYQVLTEVAEENGNQIIAASHSEVLLNEAAQRNVVIAFVGRPHRINDRGSQLIKALAEFGFDQYYQAEQKGWVLYLEGSTDLSILLEFAKRLHFQEAVNALERPFIHYVGNYIGDIKKHFWALKEATPHLIGIALLDRQENPAIEISGVQLLFWEKREIENYLCFPETLLSFAENHREPGTSMGELFDKADKDKRIAAMQDSIQEMTISMIDVGLGDPWSDDTKVSDHFLDGLFRKYYSKLGQYNLMNKTNFHILAKYVPDTLIHPEVIEKLERIVIVSNSAVVS